MDIFSSVCLILKSSWSWYTVTLTHSLPLWHAGLGWIHCTFYIYCKSHKTAVLLLHSPALLLNLCPVLYMRSLESLHCAVNFYLTAFQFQYILNAPYHPVSGPHTSAQAFIRFLHTSPSQAVSGFFAMSLRAPAAASFSSEGHGKSLLTKGNHIVLKFLLALWPFPLLRFSSG